MTPNTLRALCGEWERLPEIADLAERKAKADDLYERTNDCVLGLWVDATDWPEDEKEGIPT